MSKPLALVAALTCLLPLVLLEAAEAAPPAIGNCPVFPADHVWNTRIDDLPVDPNSDAYVATIGAAVGLKADFGAGLWDGGPIGIPYVAVPGTQPKFPASFYYPYESDPGPYAVPLDAPIEGGAQSDGDRHAIAVDTDNCILYELYDAHPGAASWSAGSGAIFDLRGYGLRPETWTSADAAGLPILAGLVRIEEVLSGSIEHAIRFTAPQTRNSYIWPARHKASLLNGAQYPPMGQRFRLKQDFDISGFSPQNQAILAALKRYGMILADNGSAWFMSGVPDEGWDNDDLQRLRSVLGSNFEAVDESSLMIARGSGQARQPAGIDPDGDGDGYSDSRERSLGKDPARYCAVMRADVNEDGRVTLADLSLAATRFLQAALVAPTKRLDQNRDGSITLADLSLIAANFLQPVSDCD